MTLAVLILAGGHGTRIGGGKPLQLLAGRTFLDRAIECARQWSDEIAIAARAIEQVGETGLTVLLDAPELDGPIAGLASARRLDCSTVLTIPCDTPFLPTDLPGRLFEGLADNHAALAASAGYVHPVCGLWRTDALARIGDYAASGRRSLIGFAETIGYAAVEWPDDPFFNVNSPEQLAEAEARLR